MINTVSPHFYRENADLLFSEYDVSQKIKSLAALISAECEGDFPLVLSVMNGALVFAGHLLPRLDFPLEVDYIHATRYQGCTEGKEITWLVKPGNNISDRNVLILDDILDEGVTLNSIVNQCYSSGAKQVKIAVLVEKELGSPKPIQADYVGFKVPDRYVFGCGMDVHGLWRNLPAIYALKST